MGKIKAYIRLFFFKLFQKKKNFYFRKILETYKKNMSEKNIFLDKLISDYKNDLKSSRKYFLELTVATEGLLSSHNLLSSANTNFYSIARNQKESIKNTYIKMFLNIQEILQLSEKYNIDITDKTERKKKEVFEYYLFGVICKLIEYKVTLFIIENIKDKDFIAFLNEGVEDRLSENSFERLKKNIFSRDNYIRIYLFFNMFKSDYQKFIKNNQNEDIIWMKNFIDFYENSWEKFLNKTTEKNLLNTLLDYSKSESKFAKLIYPYQTKLFTFIGDFKVKRKNKQLISKEQVVELENKMLPGDIILERRNWYLSNVFLNGFWPHAALYIGSPEKLKDYIDSDKEVKEFFNHYLDSEGLMDYLKKTFPEKYNNYINGYHGEEFTVIEAISEGVVFNTSMHSMHADYIGVMRSRLSKFDIAFAIIDAFYYVGAEYDFNFDFVSEHTLVCTELVVKSYAQDELKKGIKFTGSVEYGREVVKANDMCKMFEDECKNNCNQLDFVAFLRGDEDKGKADFVGSGEFEKSWKVKQIL